MKHHGFQHQALIYEGAGEFLAGTVPFLQAALDADQPILVAVRRPRAEMIRGELGAAAAAIRFVPMEEAGRNPAAIIPFWRDFVEESPGRPILGIGEPAWPERGPAALDECYRAESLLNRAFAGHPGWTLLCAYDACSLPDRELERAAISHPLISREGRTEESAAFDPRPNLFAGELSPPATDAESFQFGLKELREVRHRVAAAAERAGLGADGLADLVTATSELAANSVMHGGGSGTLRIWRENGSLLVEIEDRGWIEEPLVGRLRPNVLQEGGRGLWLVNQLCDLVQIRSGSGGTVVRVHVLAPKDAPVRDSRSLV